MEKIYQKENVYEATQERIDYIFHEFDNIVCAFSGGKDSGLLYHLVLKYMDQHGVHRKIGLMHQDFEAEYTETAKYVEKVLLRHQISLIGIGCACRWRYGTR